MADPNRALFESVVHLLAPVLDELVFVGGCRWRRDELIVDVMPVDEHILGFSNRWYPTAIETAQTLQIAGHEVRVVTPALFIATKLDAFHGRGGGDIVASHDLEDIIAVVDGRPEIGSDVAAARADVRGYIGTEIRALLDDPNFIEALGGFLLPDAASQGRRSLLQRRLAALSTP